MPGNNAKDMEPLNPSQECADEFSTSIYDADGLYARGIRRTFMGHAAKDSFFTRKGWRTLLEDVGFKIEQVETSIFKPPPQAECDDEEPMTYIIARKA